MELASLFTHRDREGPSKALAPYGVGTGEGNPEVVLIGVVR